MMASNSWDILIEHKNSRNIVDVVEIPCTFKMSCYWGKQPDFIAVLIWGQTTLHYLY